MGTVGTVTTAIPLDYPSHGTIARDPRNGYLYLYGNTDASNAFRVWRSIDGGTTWTSFVTATITGQVEWSSVVMDRYGYMHVAYRFSDSTVDRIFYRRLHLDSGSWGLTNIQVSGTNGSGDPNGGIPGQFWQGVDLAVYRAASGHYMIAVVGSCNYVGVKYGIIVHAITINPQGVVASANGLISGNRSYQVSGTSPGRTTPAIDIEHAGDGLTALTPNLWLTWGRTKLYMAKLAWNGSGWTAPTSVVTIDSSIPNMNYVSGQWDGQRWLMCVVDTDDSSKADLYERNKANSATTIRQTPAHPAGAIRTVGLSYDFSTRNPRVFAVGTSSTLLYYVDFVRNTSLWGAWATVSADSLNSSSPPDEFTIRRGGTFGNSRFDIAYTTGTTTPWTIKSAHLQQNYTPTAPTWDTSAQPYSNGGAADVATALTLVWQHNDANAADVQAAYALSRQIGAGALSYWNAGSSTWGASEVINTSGTSSVTLAAAWAAGTDAAYTFRVKTRDSGALESPYSAALVLTPSVKVNPTITAPTPAQVLATNYVPVAWTVSEQKAYRIKFVTNPGGILAYDSQWRASSTIFSGTPGFTPADNTAWTFQLQTMNNEGLPSNVVTQNFTVDYIEPPAPTIVQTPVTASGWMSVAITNPTAVGAQPAIQTVDLWRRAAATNPTLNANPSFAGNVTSYIVGGGGTAGTLSYSTTQFVSAPGAARYVPAGTGSPSAFPQVESATVLIDATKPLIGSAWIRPDTGSKPISINVNLYDAGNNYLTSVTATSTTPVAGAWHYLTVIADPTAVATAARASVGAGLTSTPTPTDAIYVDELRLQMHNTDDGTRIASNLPANATVTDWRAAARTAYEYRAVGNGANGSHVTGPWSS
jgi:hypothetical protein